MSPHKRNALTLSLALCAGVTLSTAPVAFAAGQPHPFVLSAYPRAAGGRALLDGRYRTAAQQLHGRADGAGSDAAAVDTNRCVAFSVTEQWRAAQTACDSAIRDASSERLGTPLLGQWSHASGDRRLAAAYNDRGVMRWFSHDAAGAQKDFARARALSPHSSFVRRNLAAMKFHDTGVHARGT